MAEMSSFGMKMFIFECFPILLSFAWVSNRGMAGSQCTEVSRFLFVWPRQNRWPDLMLRVERALWLKGLQCTRLPSSLRFHIIQHILQKDLKEALLVQMTGNNVKEIICGLWKTNANVEIFISAGEDCFGVNKWQQSRIGRFLSDIGNELRNIPNRGTSGAIEVFQYHAPASIRAMLFDDQLLTFGAYAYEKHYINDEHGTVLDVRGHELPHVLLAYSDPDFNTVRESLLRTIRNWKENDIVGSAMKFDRSTFGYRSART